MNLFNLFRKQPEPITVPPGEIHVTRNWTDDPMTDTTVITVGGQVHPEHLEAIRAILDGRAHATKFPRGRVKAKQMMGGVL